MHVMNEYIRITTETKCQEAMLLGASNEGVAMIAPQKKKKGYLLIMIIK